MTAQYTRGRFSTGTLVLAAAALILVGTIAISLMRQVGHAVPEVSASTVPGSPEELEALASAHPSDSGIMLALGRLRFDQGRFTEAADAFRSAARLAPDKASTWSALGEAIVMASQSDPMPAEALECFHRALRLDVKDARARYFVAVKRDLDGDHRGAIADWLALLADTPQGAPWESDLRRTIGQVGRINHIDVEGRIAATGQPAASAVGPKAFEAIPGPTAEDLRQAGGIPPSQQRQMAEDMVARLEARLRTDPRDIDGWIMLVRSRATLDQPDKASAALGQAIAANPASASRLKQEGAALGVR